MSAAICARLRAAGLLEVAERAAKRIDLRLADCIAEPPEVTGGHRALWAALAHAGKSAQEIGALLGWPEAAVARELPTRTRPAPRPIKKAPSPRPPPMTASEAAAHLERYGRAGELVRQMCDAAGVRLDELLSSSRLAPVSVCRRELIGRLSRGDLGDGVERPGWSATAIARLLRADDSTVLYHRRRAAA